MTTGAWSATSRNNVPPPRLLKTFLKQSYAKLVEGVYD